MLRHCEGIALVPSLHRQQEPAHGDSLLLCCGCPWTPGVDPSHEAQSWPDVSARGHFLRLWSRGNLPRSGSSGLLSVPLQQWLIYRWACVAVTGGHTVSSMGTLLLRAGALCVWQPWCSPVNHPVRAWWAMSSKWFIEPGSWVKLDCCPVLLNRVT